MHLNVNGYILKLSSYIALIFTHTVWVLHCKVDGKNIGMNHVCCICATVIMCPYSSGTLPYCWGVYQHFYQKILIWWLLLFIYLQYRACFFSFGVCSMTHFPLQVNSSTNQNSTYVYRHIRWLFEGLLVEFPQSLSPHSQRVRQTGTNAGP